MKPDKRPDHANSPTHDPGPLPDRSGGRQPFLRPPGGRIALARLRLRRPRRVRLFFLGGYPKIRRLRQPSPLDDHHDLRRRGRGA